MLGSRKGDLSGAEPGVTPEKNQIGSLLRLSSHSGTCKTKGSKTSKTAGNHGWRSRNSLLLPRDRSGLIVTLLEMVIAPDARRSRYLHPTILQLREYTRALLRKPPQSSDWFSIDRTCCQNLAPCLGTGL